jgi:hypothetical protein
VSPDFGAVMCRAVAATAGLGSVAWPVTSRVPTKPFPWGREAGRKRILAIYDPDQQGIRSCGQSSSIQSTASFLGARCPECANLQPAKVVGADLSHAPDSRFQRVPPCATSATTSIKRSSITGGFMSIGDQITVERLAGLIGDLKAHKATLHPGQKQ